MRAMKAFLKFAWPALLIGALLLIAAATHQEPEKPECELGEPDCIQIPSYMYPGNPNIPSYDKPVRLDEDGRRINQ
jgi:hypothetical protein